METRFASNPQNDEVFFDALDDFPPDENDDKTNNQPDYSTSSSSSSSTTLHVIPDPKPSHHLRLRRDLSGDASISSSITDNLSGLNHRDIKLRPRRNLHPPPSPATDDASTVTTAAKNDDRVADSANSAESPSQLGDDSSLVSLAFLSGLLIKSIRFQINLIISIVKFPILLIFDPLRIMTRARAFVTSHLTNLPALRFGWGLVWAVYVATLLCGVLLSSVVFSGVLMRYIVSEPLRMKEVLNFDYSKVSPVAYVLLAGVGCDESVGYRVVPAGHKLAVVVKFVLPESEYNRNLGMFQVRIDFVSAEGKTLASLSRPIMLHFRSEPIRLLLMFIKIVPLVSGYISEAQTLNIKFQGFAETDIPTQCLRVSIEQRAEFSPGAGIPEIYDVSLTLQSELPLFRRIVWSWKSTIFVWMTMMMFIMEMLFALVCCRPLIFPRARPRAAALNRSHAQQAETSTPPRN